MTWRRTLLLVVALVASALLVVAGWWFFRGQHGPETASWLPESDSIAYADVKLIRSATHFDRQWDVEHDPGYNAFSQETGIQINRDLDEIALASGGEANDTRYSEAMRGTFDRARLESWLKRNASSQEQYGGFVIFTVMHEGRPDRVAIVDGHTVLASNFGDPQLIHTMVDRYRHPQAPAVLQQFIAEVPKASPIWWIRHYDNNETPVFTLGDQSVTLGMPAATTVIGSLRYLTSLEARVLAITPSDQDAQRTANNWRSALHFARSLSRLTRGQDAVTKILTSAKVTQNGARVELTTELTREALEELARSWQQTPQR